MPESVNERRVQLAVKEGFRRHQRARRARAMFIRQYVGHYYREQFGREGDEPINMIFNVIRALVPNYVTRNPTSRVTTEIPDLKTYAYLLGMGLDNLNERLNLKNILRRAVVDALFCIGIVKTGISATDSLIEFGDIRVDPGQVFTDIVDFDDWVADPTCTVFEEAAFTGHRSRVPRQILLDDADCDHDIVMKLPRSMHADAKKRASALTQRSFSSQEMYELQDFVDVVELYVPGADTTILISDPDQLMTDRYIKMQDYYGPKTGPYRLLSLSQPVPGNPFPIAPVGIWHDLHVMCNRLMVKQMERADNQKTIIVVDPAATEQGEDMKDSRDGEVIVGNPDATEIFSTPGAEKETSETLSNLQVWFNYMAGNPDQMAGVASKSETATQATILEGNANIGLEDSRTMIYEFAAGINSDQAWYMHYDPLIDVPLIARRPGRGEELPEGVRVGQELRLTPAQRRGEHFDFTFKIRPRSMSSLDPVLMSKRVIEFATNVVPALITAAQVAAQMMVPFNVQKAISDLADQLELSDYVQDWFDDPQFMQRIQMMMAMGPKPEGKAGLNIQGVRQNRGSPMQRGTGGGGIPEQAQELAGVMQSTMKGSMRGTPGSRGARSPQGVF